MTFIGIENTNEFFTQHYLTAILQGDLRPVLERWRAGVKDQETDAPVAAATSRRPPPQALAASHQPLFRYLDRLEHETSLDARVAAHFEMFGALLVDLGYADILRHSIVELPSGHVPLYAEIHHADGSPSLWIVPVVPAHDAKLSTLSTSLAPEQLAVARAATSASPHELRPTGERTVEALINDAFNLDEPPRFILVLGLDDIVLLERAKWAEQRLLRFDLREILGRRQNDTLDVTAALLHRESLVPPDGIALLDNLDDNSHKHAFEVSEDLKYALQASIERLGNAAVDYIRRVKKQKVFGELGENEEFAEKISRECLRYMYRLLFLFYIEARPELGYAPMGVDAYRLGYSLERLRELEQLDLATEEARTGTYIHRSLRLLFDMIFDGRKPVEQGGLVENEAGELAVSHFSVFELAPLRSHLFDPNRTPLLDGGSYKRDGGVVFSNEVLRDVIENMSLTRPGKGRRGRISYATLGINQLGAVYEALLSFRGFLAKADLFEVKPEGSDDHDVLDAAYFVSEQDLPKYPENERVYDGDKLKRYPKGTFVYRLAGRDRQTSASYYTPEVLTRTTVKYALKELLEQESGDPKLTADEIIQITVCEPAMGSAAFLNEAVNQLAEAYLSAKQRECGERIPHDKFGFEKQRVKMFIADNNVFGVDLNPIAVELAEVSLWLNTIHEGGFVPWFTGQTVCGNSLIGARRQVFPASTVRAAGEGKSHDWLDAVPARVPLGTARPIDSIYHFFLGDRSMSVYGRGPEGEPIREMAKEALEQIDKWRKGFCAPLKDDETDTMIRLSGIVDSLWEKHADILKRIRARTTDPIQVYGQPALDDTRKPTTTADKDRIWAQEMLSETVSASSPYRRLKLVMNYWCALWFWPTEHAELLPDREEFLADVAWVLDTHVVMPPAEPGTQVQLFATTAPDEGQQLAMEHGFVDLNKLVARNPRLQLVETLAQRYRFLHWELEFADVFKVRGGFDLFVGNPPWIKVEWSERDVLSDFDPSFVLKELSSTDTASRRAEVLAHGDRQQRYITAHEQAAGTQAFLSVHAMFPELVGQQPNLYKCFLPIAWSASRPCGYAALLHADGIFADPGAGRLRLQVYRRLRRHYHFRNEKELFQGTNDHGRLVFSINVYGPPRDTPSFDHLANIFSPSTIDSCEHHLGLGPVPGIKDEFGEWDLHGHRDRIIRVTQRELKVFARLFDGVDSGWAETRLPPLHSRQLIGVLEILGAPSARVGDLDVFAHDMWHESRAKKAGSIKPNAGFPTRAEDLVLSGPHFYVANPLSKTPRAECSSGNHYDAIDLTVVMDDYLPRSNYVPAVVDDEYRSRMPSPSFRGAKGKVVDYFRLAVNRALNIQMERTLQPAIVPPGFSHIDAVYTYTFARLDALVRTAAFWSSLPLDFLVKVTGAGDLRPNVGLKLPLGAMSPSLAVRILMLNCVSARYSLLWSKCFDEGFRVEQWSKTDPRLADNRFLACEPEWHRGTPLRSDYERRQALVEIDVLASRALGFTLEQLTTMYRVQFPTLRANELDTWYDRCGRIVFTSSKGLTGVGLPRTVKRGDPAPSWSDVREMRSGTLSRTMKDDTQPGGPRSRTIIYEAPFDRCDRERDYETAWAHFEKRDGEGA